MDAPSTPKNRNADGRQTRPTIFHDFERTVGPDCNRNIAKLYPAVRNVTYDPGFTSNRQTDSPRSPISTGRRGDSRIPRLPDRAAGRKKKATFLENLLHCCFTANFRPRPVVQEGGFFDNRVIHHTMVQKQDGAVLQGFPFGRRPIRWRSLVACRSAALGLR